MNELHSPEEEIPEEKPIPEESAPEKPSVSPVSSVNIDVDAEEDFDEFDAADSEKD